jgi:DMSO/TMAO reductase YedYZ molybdopterin-dependent catalytic subunit
MVESEIIISPDTKREVRIPPGQTGTDDFPVLHYGETVEIDISKWTFNITGLVEEERILNFNEFSSLPKVTLIADIHCVTGWSKLNTEWEGVSTKQILNLITLKPEAKYVLVHGAKGFTTNLSLEDFIKDDVIFALNYNNAPLTRSHGYPVRLIVPRLYFWKSAKWVTGIEIIEYEKLGFWETHGYHSHGDPWKEERYS